MEIIKNAKVIDSESLITPDYSIAGVFVQRRVLAGHEDELFEVIGQKDFRTKGLLFIDHPGLYRSKFNDTDFLLEVLERVPNLVLSCNELGLLFEIKNKLSEYEKHLKIAHKRVCKGVDFYLYPRMFQNDNMVNDIVNRANKGIKIMVSGSNFPNGRESRLPEIESRLNERGRVLVYTNTPRLVKQSLKHF